MKNLNVAIQTYARLESFAAPRHLETLERAYLEHPAVREVAVFIDQLGQLVVLAVSDEANEAQLRLTLEAIASDRLCHAIWLADLVVLPTADPLVPGLFPGTRPHRNLIWQFLVGTIDTLTTAGNRFCPTCHQELLTTARHQAHHRHDPPAHREDFQ